MAAFTAREITREASTARTQRLKERYLDAEMRLDLAWPMYTTEYFKQNEGQPLVERRASAFKYALQRLTPVIRDDELIVGCQTRHLRGSHPYPEFSVNWIKEELALDSTQEKETLFEVGQGGAALPGNTLLSSINIRMRTKIS